MEKSQVNKPASGVDEITYEEYDSEIRMNLKQLQLELIEHRYEPLPVKLVDIYKGEKKRTISLFSMRDKVVQQSITSELLKIYDKEMSDSTYAYRPGKAALQAIEFLGEEIKKPEMCWILKVDIKSFFDCISHENLYRILQKKIKEQDVLEVIQKSYKSRILEKSGEIREKRLGIAQGSSIAPILSNIYLMQFDFEMKSKCNVYVRYSDDIIVFGESKEQMKMLKAMMEVKLQNMGLQLNEEKTEIKSVEEGVSFLGYELSKIGKTIPKVAETNLLVRLEEVWLKEKTSIEEKLRKSAGILEGWEQYYREEREIQSIQEYATIVYMVRRKQPEVLMKIKQKRKSFDNIYKEIGVFLARVWEEIDDLELVLLEYEQIYELDKLDSEKIMENLPLYCEVYKELELCETEETWSNLMQMYSDNSAYNKAAKIFEYISRLDKKQEIVLDIEENMSDDIEECVISTAPDFVQAYLKVFGGREDVYGKEELTANRKRCVEQVAEPLTEQVIKEHLKGICTISTYVQRSNYTVKYLVIDVDISKRVFLQGTESDIIAQYLPKAAQVADNILKVLDKMGLKGYLEYSGFRGYHIWIFFTEWIPTRYVCMLTDIIDSQRDKTEESVNVEYFPNKGKLRNGSFGQTMKLPLGFHAHSAKRSMLLERDFQAVFVDKEYLFDIAQFSLLAVKRIIAFYNGIEETVEEKVVDSNIEQFGELPESVKIVLERCNLMRYLCQKAKSTGYLTHFERLSILYVFGHLGEEGKMFVHSVMELTLNYQYHVTDKFIQKLPPKPVSCLKLREQYKQITAEYGCSCNFKRTKNCYPSPVLHAIKSSEEIASDVTIPTTKTLTKEKEKKVVEEINIHKKVQELAGKIIEMKKQRRGVDKAIQKAESELEKIYDQAGVDCLEVDMGLLVRRKKEQGYEWLIEI